MIEKPIKKTGPEKRDPLCLQTQHAILIPKGTILRQEPGKAGVFTCPVAHGVFSINRADGEGHPDTFKRVVA